MTDTRSYVLSMTVAELRATLVLHFADLMNTIPKLDAAIDRAVAILDAEPAARPRRHAREIKR